MTAPQLLDEVGVFVYGTGFSSVSQITFIEPDVSTASYLSTLTHIP